MVPRPRWTTDGLPRRLVAVPTFANDRSTVDDVGRKQRALYSLRGSFRLPDSPCVACVASDCLSGAAIGVALLGPNP